MSFDKLQMLTFDEGIKSLTAFKEKNGHVNVTSDYVDDNGINLGKWVKSLRQRMMRKNSTLTDNQKNILAEMGVTSSVYESTFKAGVAETLQYKALTGDANAPERYISPSGFRLGSWQYHWRDVYKKSGITEERKALLAPLGFVWDIKSVRYERYFLKYYELLKKYKEEFGDLLIKETYVTPQGDSLGSWFGTIRDKFRRNQLEHSQIKLLQEIGVPFVMGESCRDIRFKRSFERGCSETLKIKEAKGSGYVPCSYKTPEGFCLGGWQFRIKEMFMGGLLTEDEILQIDNLGLIKGWEQHRATRIYKKG